VSAADIARLRNISRSQAWRILRTLHAQHGQKKVRPFPRPDGCGSPPVIWRGARDTVMLYFEALDKTPEERIAELARRIDAFEEELEERDTRIDQLARDLQALRDMTGARRP
jgi:hypothetical protein